MSFSRVCVVSATLPIYEVSGVCVKCFPYPKFVFLLSDVVPHFIKFQDDGGSGWQCRFRGVLFRRGAYPFENRRYMTAEEF